MIENNDLEEMLLIPGEVQEEFSKEGAELLEELPLVDRWSRWAEEIDR